MITDYKLDNITKKYTNLTKRRTPTVSKLTTFER
jgi:hypothetical protein